MIEWLLARITEPTTWLGLTTLITTAGVALAPELKDAIVATGVSIGGLIAVIMKEKSK